VANIYAEKNPSQDRLAELDVGSWEEDQLAAPPMPSGSTGRRALRPSASDFPWSTKVKQTWHILEGRARLQLTSGGSKVEIEPGDIVTFRKGSSCVMRITATLKMRCHFGDVGPSDEVGDLIKTLRGGGYFERIDALKEAARLKDPRLVEILVWHLDADEELASFARKALSEIGEAAVEPLITCLSGDVSTRTGTSKVRSRAASLLGKLGDTRAIDPLVAALEDENEQVSEAARLSLENLGYSDGEGSET